MQVMTKHAFLLLFGFCSYSLAFFGGSDNYVDKFQNSLTPE